MWASLGSYDLLPKMSGPGTFVYRVTNKFKCLKKCVDRFGGYEPVTPLSKEIGLGPSMFLMTTKSLAILFFFLSVLNIPLYFFFYTSNQGTLVHTQADYFHKFSLGNSG